MDLHGLSQEYLYHLWTSTTCHRNSFTFLHVDDVRTWQEAHLWASTTCYRDGFTFCHILSLSDFPSVKNARYCIGQCVHISGQSPLAFCRTCSLKPSKCLCRSRKQNGGTSVLLEPWRHRWVALLWFTLLWTVTHRQVHTLVCCGHSYPLLSDEISVRRRF
jgi:hypothetical protein